MTCTVCKGRGGVTTVDTCFRCAGSGLEPGVFRNDTSAFSPGYRLFLKKQARKKLREEILARAAKRRTEEVMRSYEHLRETVLFDARPIESLKPAGKAPPNFLWLYTWLSLLFGFGSIGFFNAPWATLPVIALIYGLAMAAGSARPRLTGKFSLGHARKIVGRLADPPKRYELVDAGRTRLER